MNIAVLLVGVLAVFVIAYRVVGRFLERETQMDAARPTPAHASQDGVDFVPTHPLILFGHHFSSIAGAGPIVGPIIAGLAFGWGPALLWVVVGAVLVGGIHDFTTLLASVRHRGETIGQVCKRYLDPLAYHALLAFIWLAMIYVLIVFLDLTATSFAPESPKLLHEGGAVATASVVYIGLAVLFGVAVYRWKLSLLTASVVFVPLVFVGMWVGHVWPWTADQVPAWFGSAKNTWSVGLLGYCFLAAVLPVWVLLQPRDYLSSYLLVACLVGGAVGILVGGGSGSLPLEYPAFRGWRDAQLGYVFPALFITVACGAMSGFHSIVASGTTSKQLANERDARPVAYGGMLVEGVLAVVALAAVMVLAQAPAGQTPVAVFALGMGKFLGVFGINPQLATTFGLLAVSTFLLTTLDTCTRLGRFIVQEFFGLTGTVGRYVGTAATLAIPAVMVFVQIEGPTGQPMPAWKAIWPAFGATNQLLGALALLVVYSWLRHAGRKTWYVFVPMVFMCGTTLTALTQLVYQNLLTPGGSRFIGGVSAVMGLLAVALLVNAGWRLRKLARQRAGVTPVAVTETA
ncbi:MAG: Peptide transporter CstA [Verrucomicrobiae bacterium]|nr:Peptide transporter CstA [Verrucomicrobiae bacterium]